MFGVELNVACVLVSLGCVLMYVPRALPYLGVVGGVEWSASTYCASAWCPLHVFAACLVFVLCFI